MSALPAHVRDTTGTIARFPNLSGALVLVDQAFDTSERTTGSGAVRPAPAAGWPAISWACTGCHIASPDPADGYPAVRDAANDHAATCRALPPIGDNQ